MCWFISVCLNVSDTYLLIVLDRCSILLFLRIITDLTVISVLIWKRQSAINKLLNLLFPFVQIVDGQKNIVG